MTVNFFSTLDDILVVTKTLTSVASVVCTPYKECNIMNPVLILTYNANILNANYFYIDEWHRYYFMSPPSVTPGQQMIINGEIDPLMTYSDSIRSLTCHVVRQENNTAKYLSDPTLPVKTITQTQNIQFNASPFDTSDKTKMHFLLTVIGG